MVEVLIKTQLHCSEGSAVRRGVCVHAGAVWEMVGPCSQLDIWEDFLEKEMLQINSKG